MNTAGDCSQKGQICGVIKNSQIDSAECFDECQPGQVGTFRNICVAGSNIAYEHQEECVDIGYGRFGYLEVPGTFNQCPAGCTGGRCYDYTQDFDKYGQPCDLATANDSCLAEAMVAYCDNNQENPVYNVMVCTGNKICATVSLEGQIKASCNEQCTAGAEDRHICDVYGLGYASVTYHCTQQSSGKYAYVASESQFCDSARGCADDGRCK